MSTHPDPAPSNAFASYIGALRAHPFVIAAAIVAALAGSALFVLRSRTYEATAEILVTPISPEDQSFVELPLPRGDFGDPARAVQTAATVIDSPAAAELAAKHVQGESGGVIRSAVSVKPVTDSDVVEVTASAANPDKAADSANAYARAALAVRKRELRSLVGRALGSAETELARQPDPTSPTSQVLRTRIVDLRSIRDGTDPTLSLTQQAVPPGAPVGLPRALVLGLALVAGTVIGLVASLLIELLVPRRVKSELDVVRLYPLPILTRVPLVRPGGSKASEPPLPVANAFRMLRTQLEMRTAAGDDGPPGSPSAGGRPVVVVTSPSPGDGRTTTALGLARALARRQLTALVMDLDFGRPAVAPRLGLQPEHDLASMLAGGLTLSDLITPVPGNPRLAVVAAPPDVDLSMAERLAILAPDLIAEARSFADWVVVDGPPLSQASELVTFAYASDHLVLVSRMGHTDEAALTAARDLLEQLSVVPAGHVLIGAGRLDLTRQAGAASTLRPAAAGQRASSR